MHLVQFILPLTLLAIWALTSLFNREAPPLPQRQGRPFGPDGPRPGERPQPARGLARPGDPRPASVPPRWSPTSASGPATRRPAAGNDDDILIIESEPRRPSSGLPMAPRPGAAAGGRRTVRPRASAPPSPKKPEPAQQRILGVSLRSEMSASLNKSAELKPLGKTPPPLYAHEALEGVKTAHGPGAAARASVTHLSSTSVGEITAAKLRQAILMNEILLPPRAARPFRSARS